MCRNGFQLVSGPAVVVLPMPRHVDIVKQPSVSCKVQESVGFPLAMSRLRGGRHGYLGTRTASVGSARPVGEQTALFR
eukprot:8697467-Alexandrium_andersonii.AAC.1